MKRLLSCAIFVVCTLLCTAQQKMSLEYGGGKTTKDVELASKHHKSQWVSIEFSYVSNTNQIKMTVIPRHDEKNKYRAIWFPTNVAQSKTDDILYQCQRDVPNATCVGAFYGSQSHWGVKEAFGCGNCTWDRPDRQNGQRSAVDITETPQSVDFFFSVDDREKPVRITLQNASVLQRKNFFAPQKQRLVFIADSNELSWELKIDIPVCETMEAKKIVEDAGTVLSALKEDVAALKQSRNSKELKNSLDENASYLEGLERRYENLKCSCEQITTILEKISETLSEARNSIKKEPISKTSRVKDISNQIIKSNKAIIRCSNAIKTAKKHGDKAKYEQKRNEALNHIKETDNLISNMSVEEKRLPINNKAITDYYGVKDDFQKLTK